MLGPKWIYVQKFGDKQNLDTKRFWVKTKLCPQILGVQRMLGSINILEQKSFGHKQIFDEKNFKLKKIPGITKG